MRMVKSEYISILFLILFNCNKFTQIGKIHPRMVYNLCFRHYCSNTFAEINQNKAKNTICSCSNVTEVPEAPTTCCMTGCPNCVWLNYAEKLTEYFKDGGDKAWKEINTHVTDPNIKAYLTHELRTRNNK